MNYTIVDFVNFKKFISVIPDSLASDDMGISLVAYEDDGSICGGVSLSFDSEEYNIDWLYVIPEKRRQGVGRGLVFEVIKLVRFSGIAPVRIQYDATQKNGIHDFIQALEIDGFPPSVTFSHDRYTVSVGNFLDSDFIRTLKKRKRPMGYDIDFLLNMDKNVKKEAYSLAMDHFNILDEKQFENSCEKLLCLAVRGSGKLLSLSLAQRLPSKALKLSYLYADDPKALLCMLLEFASTIVNFDREETIYFDTVTDESSHLAKKLFPDAIPEKIYEAEL